jgi:hypothetical protein
VCGDGLCSILCRKGHGRVGSGRFESPSALPCRRRFGGGRSVVEAETAAEAGRVEEGQGELVMVHEEALVKKRVRASPSA